MTCFAILLVISFFLALFGYPMATPKEERSCGGYLLCLTLGTLASAISLWFTWLIIWFLLGL